LTGLTESGQSVLTEYCADGHREKQYSVWWINRY